MRKAQKKQAEDFVKLLSEAHGEIKGAIEKKNFSAARSLLADCQEGAIALGDLIEAAEGEGFATIPLLESYCEAVYHAHQELERGQGVNAGKICKTLRQSLYRVESSVKNDVRIRTEAVFLPYKASMWDSLESIWKAADDDPDCDAYVIPIPYYDKNPDGSFRGLHYEGGEYPGYVPVVWYEDYDFETRRPDMIYIHNPYDDCNIVTSVHPFFYSKNLKEYTDKLVYVPYFILGEVNPDNKQELKEIEKFCLVPGVVHANQVIVQSEDMRQAYVNVLTEFLSGQGRDRAYWEKKILGLGSPKVDKVLNTRKEDLEIPQEWMKVIRKPDGSWKKIILYNTTVTALLKHNEQYLVKMRDVLRVFYGNRDEVALLWRPHPLFGATIQSMRPEMREAYEEIVQAYRKGEWGIYDDSVDMDRAVCLSDGYYGDMSSLVWLYQKVNKFVMIQSQDLTEKITKNSSGDCIILDNGICWYDKNYIMLKNIEQGKTKTYRWLYIGQYIAACILNDYIYFAPMEGNEICILDLHNNQMDYVNLVWDSFSKICNKFYCAKKHGDGIYFLPGKYPYILEYRLDNRELKRYPLDLHKLAVSSKDDLVFYESAYFYQDTFFCASANNGTICSFDIKSKERKYYHIADNDGFSTICGYGKDLYLSDKEGTIFKMKIGGKRLDCVKIFHCNNTHFRKSIYWNDRIIMFMEEKEKCLFIDSENETLEWTDLFREESSSYDGNRYGEPKIWENRLYIYVKDRKKLVFFNLDMTIEVNDIEINDIEINQTELNHVEEIENENINGKSERVVFENNAIQFNTLKFYLKNIQSIISLKHSIVEQSPIGMKIEKRVKDG